MKVTRIIHMRAPLVIRIQEMHMRGEPIKLPKHKENKKIEHVSEQPVPKEPRRFARMFMPPVILADRNNKTGGATVIVMGDTTNPGFVTVQTAWCKYTDDYSRKVGRTIAQCADPEVVPLRLLPNTLREIEDQMLSHLCTHLRNNEDRRRTFIRDWSDAVHHFLPTQEDLSPKAC
jgi:hypothetical protein